MLKNKFRTVAWMAAMAVSLCSCQFQEVANTDLGTKIDKQEIAEYTDIHIRDKDLLYYMYDNTEIVTMYLTISKGNEGEGTNHTWEEINTYSVYDYDYMGVDRYKVAGLLQVGNEEGLIPGELGYGQVAPNSIVQISFTVINRSITHQPFLSGGFPPFSGAPRCRIRESLKGLVSFPLSESKRPFPIVQRFPD